MYLDLKWIQKFKTLVVVIRLDYLLSPHTQTSSFKIRLAYLLH